ncbi:hypothetical protein [Shewanella sp. DC2-4]|uniref:hypothetical protein n=1 Tax=Shewanella sp. DC2-4 TaxID=2739431 RepID=UPI001C27134E|nr:hypothetical protein [Shewanella sp. DC2-4]
MSLFRKASPFIVPFLLLGMAGCVSQSYTDSKKEAESMQSRIEQLTPSNALNNVSVITRPPVIVTPLVKTQNIPWLSETIKVHVTRLPLSQVLSDVMRGVPANIWFDNDVNASTTVTLSANTTRQNILNLLASQTSYGFVPTQDKVEVRRYLSETFTLSIPIGTVSAQQGSTGSTGGGENPQVEGQFISTTLSNVDMIQEVTTAIKAVLKSNEESNELIGGVEAVPSLSSFIVRTTPDRMRQMFSRS